MPSESLRPPINRGKRGVEWTICPGAIPQHLFSEIKRQSGLRSYLESRNWPALTWQTEKDIINTLLKHSSSCGNLAFSLPPLRRGFFLKIRHHNRRPVLSFIHIIRCLTYCDYRLSKPELTLSSFCIF